MKCSTFHVLVHKPLSSSISVITNRLLTFPPGSSYYLSDITASSCHQVFQFAFSVILPLRCPPSLVCTKSQYNSLRQKSTGVGEFSSESPYSPSPSVSFPSSLSVFPLKSPPLSVTQSVTSFILNQCRPPSRPMFPYFCFYCPYVHPSPLSFPYIYFYVRGGKMLVHHPRHCLLGNILLHCAT